MSVLGDLVTAPDTRRTAELPSSVEEVDELLAGWLDPWNGDLARADQVLRADFRTHAAMTGGGDGSEIAGPAGPAAWVATTRALMADLRVADRRLCDYRVNSDTLQMVSQLQGVG